jgi:ribonucleotide monophosphatase NagD (HAD superfamily)
VAQQRRKTSKKCFVVVAQQRRKTSKKCFVVVAQQRRKTSHQHGFVVVVHQMKKQNLRASKFLARQSHQLQYQTLSKNF